MIDRALGLDPDDVTLQAALLMAEGLVETRALVQAATCWLTCSTRRRRR